MLPKLFFVVMFINFYKNAESSLITTKDLLKSVENVPQADDTLIFTHILFRHGDRTPTTDSTYPTNPYKYTSYWPIGIGQLTKKGMVETYKLGLELRQRYNKFLGKTYSPDLIGALSSPKPRCQTSLQCVLTSLFPPDESEQFVAGLQWRPIQYDILQAQDDDTFAMYECDDYWNLENRISNQTILNLFEYLTIHTRQEIRNNSDLFLVRDAIEVTYKMGKPQPDWVMKIFPEPLMSAADQTYYDFIDQRLLLGASGFYRRMTSMTLDKLNGTLPSPRRKMMLYSAHEQTIVYALGGIKAYQGQVPEMASYLAFELHYINRTFGFKVFFQNYEHIKPVEVNILGQGTFCSLDTFLEETKWLTKGPKPFCK